MRSGNTRHVAERREVGGREDGVGCRPRRGRRRGRVGRRAAVGRRGGTIVVVTARHGVRWHRRSSRRGRAAGGERSAPWTRVHPTSLARRLGLPVHRARGSVRAPRVVAGATLDLEPARGRTVAVMRFLPYHELDGRPNVIVDGSPTDGTVLTVTHWPGYPPPPEVVADTSAEMAFRLLEHPELMHGAALVSNNHFDQDGLVSIYTVVDPEGDVATSRSPNGHDVDLRSSTSPSAHPSAGGRPVRRRVGARAASDGRAQRHGATRGGHAGVVGRTTSSCATSRGCSCGRTRCGCGATSCRWLRA